MKSQILPGLEGKSSCSSRAKNYWARSASNFMLREQQWQLASTNVDFYPEMGDLKIIGRSSL